MKALTILCNVVLLLFTVFVLVSEGLPKEAPYYVLTLLLLLIPIFTVWVLVRGEAGRRTAIRRAAAICNLVLLGLICWAIVDQYPHPEERGFVGYVVLVVLTPILSAVVLLRRGGGPNRRGLGTKPSAPQL